ncbi:SDR family NAD(P)-dependent oxidoreductase (plasmid) [Photobacterium sp. GJ3]|uniref:SDR family NAD(P)-dependent oxidoreductase n=1 Tax=Photobacterium sp. GJ3 TaxID=2829502 RepID=UPI001B8B7F11|nr:SDR family NAD(P)-dependent oxidoreductase [Photobacterium sp. GJ3]QUJ70643.1 SDR family NAD(P)-dependent oxidoreductase [Photobacterium sp. GJ3]
MTFQNKTVWITGASSGIGQALAEQFAAQGANVILTARRKERLDTILAGLARQASDCTAGLSQPERLLQDLPSILDEIGRVDILINNAGISQRSLFLENEFKVYRQLMEVNYFGLVAMTKAVLPRMIEAGGGSVVSISSVAGKVGSKLRTGYSGSKYAVVGFMDCLRAEVSEYGIHCLTICPALSALPLRIILQTGSKLPPYCPPKQMLKAIAAHGQLGTNHQAVLSAAV